MKYTQTKLETTQGHNLFYNKEYLLPYTDDLLSFISDKAYMKTFNFALDSMMPFEIMANNNIEGITSDLKAIDNIMQDNTESIKPSVLNLYKGYKYILSTRNLLCKKNEKLTNSYLQEQLFVI